MRTDEEGPPPPTAMPFVIAAAIFVVVAVAAVLFLREDSSLTALRPDDVEIVDDATVLATATFDECLALERAQVDLDVDTVFVELVVGEVEGCDCGDVCAEQSVEAEIVLPEPIGDRRVVPGVGRFEIPCRPDGRCAAER